MTRIGGNLYTVYGRRKRVCLSIVGILLAGILASVGLGNGNPAHIAAFIMGAWLVYSYLLVALGHYPALRRVHPEVQRAIDEREQTAAPVMRDPAHITRMGGN